MRFVVCRLRGKKGETLAETMVSALITGIGLLILASMILASQRIMADSDDAVKKFYQETSKIEKRTGTSEAQKVIVEDSEGTKAEINVTVYQGDGGEIAAYAK